MSYLTSLEKRASFPLRPAEQKEEVKVDEVAAPAAPAFTSTVPGTGIRPISDLLPSEGKTPEYSFGDVPTPKENPFDIAFGSREKVAALYSEIVDTTARKRYEAGQLAEKYNFDDQEEEGFFVGLAKEAGETLMGREILPREPSDEKVVLKRTDVDSYMVESPVSVSGRPSPVTGLSQLVLGASAIDPESRPARELKKQGRTAKKIPNAEDIRVNVTNERLRAAFISQAKDKESGAQSYSAYVQRIADNLAKEGKDATFRDAQLFIAGNVIARLPKPAGQGDPGIVVAQRDAVNLVSQYTDPSFTRGLAQTLPMAPLRLGVAGSEKLGDRIDPSRVFDPYVEEDTEMKRSDPLGARARGPMTASEAERAQFLEQRMFFPVDFEYDEDKSLKTSTTAAQTMNDLIVDGSLILGGAEGNFDDMYGERSVTEVYSSKVISGESDQNRLIALAAKAGIPVDKTYAVTKAESTGNPASFAFNLHLGQHNPKDPSNPRNRTAEQEQRLRQLMASEGLKVNFESRAAQNYYGKNARRALDLAAAINPVAAVQGGAFGEFQVTGKYGDALGYVKETFPEVETDEQAAGVFLNMFKQSPGVVGDDMFVRWFQRNPDAQKAANDGDISGLAKEYYGSLSDPEEVGISAAEKARREKQVETRDGWVGRATNASEAYLGGMIDSARKATRPEAQSAETSTDDPPTSLSQQGLLENESVFTSEESREDISQVEEALQLRAVEVETGVSTVMTMFGDMAQAPTPGSSAFIAAVAPIKDAKENDAQLYTVVKDNRDAPMGTGYRNVANFLFERKVNTTLGERSLSDLSAEETKRLKAEARQEAFAVVTSAQTENLWRTSFYTSFDYLLGEEADSVFAAMAPRIEVMGRTKDGFVFRQEGDVLAAAAALDAPAVLGQSFNIGVIGNYLFPAIEAAYTEYEQGNRGAASLAFAVTGETVAAVAGSFGAYIPYSNDIGVEFLNEVHRAGVQGVAERQNFVEVGLSSGADVFGFAAESLLETEMGRETLDMLIASGSLPIPYELTSPGRRHLAVVDMARATGTAVGMLGGLVAAVGVPDATDFLLIPKVMKTGRRAYRLIKDIDLSVDGLEALTETKTFSRAVGSRSEMFLHGEARRTTLAQLAATLEQTSAKDLQGASSDEIATLLQLVDDILDTSRKQDATDGVFRNDLTASVKIEVDLEAESALRLRAETQTPAGEAARYALDKDLSKDVHATIVELIKEASASKDPRRVELAEALGERLKASQLREAVSLSPGQTDAFLSAAEEVVGPKKVFGFTERIEILRDALLLIDPASDGMAIRKKVFSRRVTEDRLSRVANTDTADLPGFVDPTLSKGLDRYGPVTEEALKKSLSTVRLADAKKGEILQARTKLQGWHDRFKAAVADNSILDPQVRSVLLDEFKAEKLGDSNYRVFSNSDRSRQSSYYRGVIKGIEGVAGDATNAAFGQNILARGLQGVLAAADSRGAAYKRFAVALVDKRKLEALDSSMDAEKFLAGGETALRMRRFRYALQSATKEGVMQIMLSNPVMSRLIPEGIRAQYAVSASARMAKRQEMLRQGKSPLDLTNLLKREALTKLSQRLAVATTSGDQAMAAKLTADIDEVKSPQFFARVSQWMDDSITEVKTAAAEGREPNLPGIELPVGIDPAIVNRMDMDPKPLSATRKFFRESYSPAFGFGAVEEVPAGPLTAELRTRRARLSTSEKLANEVVLDHMLRYMAGVDRTDTRVIAERKVTDFLEKRLTVRSIGSYDFESRRVELRTQLDDLSEQIAQRRFGQSVNDLEPRARVQVRSDAFNVIIPLMTDWEASLILARSSEELKEILANARLIGPRLPGEEAGDVILSTLFQDPEFMARLRKTGGATRRRRKAKPAAKAAPETAETTEAPALPAASAVDTAAATDRPARRTRRAAVTIDKEAAPTGQVYVAKVDELDEGVPDSVLEAESAFGNSALLWSSLSDRMGGLLEQSEVLRGSPTLGSASSTVVGQRAVGSIGRQVLGVMVEGLQGLKAEDSSDFFVKFAEALKSTSRFDEPIRLAVTNNPEVVVTLAEVFSKQARGNLTQADVTAVENLLRKAGVLSSELSAQDLLKVNGEETKAALAADTVARADEFVPSPAATKATLPEEVARSSALEEAVENIAKATGSDEIRRLLTDLKDSDHGRNIEAVLRAIDMIGPERLKNISLVIEPAEGQSAAKRMFDFTNETIRVYDDALESGEFTPEVLSQLWQSLTRYVPDAEVKALKDEWLKERDAFMRANPDRFGRDMTPIGDFVPDEMTLLSFDQWIANAARNVVLAEINPKITNNPVLQAFVDTVSALVEQFKLRGKKVGAMALEFLNKGSQKYQEMVRDGSVDTAIRRATPEQYFGEQLKWQAFLDNPDARKPSVKAVGEMEAIDELIDGAAETTVKTVETFLAERFGKRAILTEEGFSLLKAEAVKDDVSRVLFSGVAARLQELGVSALDAEGKPLSPFQMTELFKEVRRGLVEEAADAAKQEGGENFKKVQRLGELESELAKLRAAGETETPRVIKLSEDINELDADLRATAESAGESTSPFQRMLETKTQSERKVLAQSILDSVVAVIAKIDESPGPMTLDELLEGVEDQSVINEVRHLLGVAGKRGDLLSQVRDDGRLLLARAPGRVVLPEEDLYVQTLRAEAEGRAYEADELADEVDKILGLRPDIARDEARKLASGYLEELRQAAATARRQRLERGAIDASMLDELLLNEASSLAADAARTGLRADLDVQIDEIVAAVPDAGTVPFNTTRKVSDDFDIVSFESNPGVEQAAFALSNASSLRKSPPKSIKKGANESAEAFAARSKQLMATNRSAAITLVIDMFEGLRPYIALPAEIVVKRNKVDKTIYLKDVLPGQDFSKLRVLDTKAFLKKYTELIEEALKEQGLLEEVKSLSSAMQKSEFDDAVARARKQKSVEAEPVVEPAAVEPAAARTATDDRFVLKAREMFDDGKTPRAAESVREAIEKNAGSGAAKAFGDEYKSLRDAAVQARVRQDAAEATTGAAEPKATPSPTVASPTTTRSLPKAGEKHTPPTPAEARAETAAAPRNERGVSLGNPAPSRDDLPKIETVVKPYREMGKQSPETLAEHASARGIDLADHSTPESLANAVGQADVKSARVAQAVSGDAPPAAAKAAPPEAFAAAADITAAEAKTVNAIDAMVDALAPENADKVAKRVARLQKLIDKSEEIEALSAKQVVDYVFDDLDVGARETLANSGAIDDIVKDLTRIFNQNVADVKRESRRLRRTFESLQKLAKKLEGKDRERALRAAARAERQATSMEEALRELLRSDRLDEFADLLETERAAGKVRRKAEKQAREEAIISFISRGAPPRPPGTPKTPRNRGVDKVPKNVKGMVYFLDDSQAIIYAFKSADAETGLHEMAHVLRRNLRDADLQVSLGWVNSQLEARGMEKVRLAYGVDSRTGNFIGRGDSVHYAEELFAEGFEQYMREGVAPTKMLENVFKIMKELLHNIFVSAKRQPEKIEISPEMYAVFDRVFGAKQTFTMDDMPDAMMFLNVQDDLGRSVVGLGGRLETDLILEDTVTGRFRQLEMSLDDYRRRMGKSGEAGIVGKVASKLPTPKAAVGGLGLGSRTSQYLDPVSSRVLSAEDRMLLNRFRRGEIERSDLPNRLLPEIEKGLRVTGEAAVLVGSLTLKAARLMYGDDASRVIRTYNPAQRVHMKAGAREGEEFSNGASVLINDISRRMGASAERALNDIISYFSGQSAQLLTGSERGKRLNATNVDIFEHVSRMFHDMLWRMDPEARVALIQAAENRLSKPLHATTQDDILPLSGLWNGYVVRNRATPEKSALSFSGEGILLSNDYIDVVKPGLAKGGSIEIDSFLQDTLGDLYVAVTGQPLSKGTKVPPTALDMAALLVLHSGGSMLKASDGSAVHLDQVLKAAGVSRGEALIKGVTAEVNGSTVKVPGLMTTSVAVERRLPVLMSLGHAGFASGMLDDAAKWGFGLTGREYRAFMRYVTGQQGAMSLSDIEMAKSVISRFGISAEFVTNSRRHGQYYLPKQARDALRDQMSQAARQFDYGEKGGKSSVARDAFGIYNSLLYSTMVFGAVVVKPFYRLASLIDLGLGALGMGGARAATAAVTRAGVSTLLAFAYEGFPLLSAERAAEAVGLAGDAGRAVVRRVRGDVDSAKTVLDFKQQIRDVAAESGDNLARMITETSASAKYRPEVRPIMEARADMIFVINGRPYRASDLRRIFVRSGLYNNMFKSIKATYMAEGGSLTEVMDRVKRSVKEKYGDDAANVKMLDSFLEETTDTKNPFNIMGGIRGAGDMALRHGLESADAWADLERTGLAVTFMELGHSPQTAARMVVEAVYDYRGSMTSADRSMFNKVTRPFFAFTKNAIHHLTNMMSSPLGRFYARSMAKLPFLSADAATAVLYEFLVGPYGINTSAMNSSEVNAYYDMRNFLEYGLGEQVDRNTLQQYREILPDEAKDISDQELMDHDFGGWTIRNGYNGYDNVPEDARVSVRALIASRSKLYAKGRYLYVAKVLQDEELREEFVKLGGAMAVQDEPSRRGQASYMYNRYPTIQVPFPVLNASAQEAMRLGLSDSVYWMLPDNFVHSGIAEASAMMATALVVLDESLNAIPGGKPFFPDVAATRAQRAAAPLIDIRGYGSPIAADIIKGGAALFGKGNLFVEVDPLIARVLQGSMIPVANADDIDEDDLGILLQLAQSDPELYNQAIKVFSQMMGGSVGREIQFPAFADEVRAARMIVKDGRREVVFANRGGVFDREFLEKGAKDSSEKAVRKKPFLVGKSAVLFKITPLGQLNQALLQYRKTPQEGQLEAQKELRSEIIRFITAQGRQVGMRTSGADEERVTETIERAANKVFEEYK